MLHPIAICLLTFAVCSGEQDRRAASFARSLAAEKYLLKGSTLLHADSPRLVIYQRPGGRYTAYADFLALKPNKVVNKNKRDMTEIRGKVGNYASVIFTFERDMWPDIELTRFVPGKDPEYSFYVKVFWYMGDRLKDGYIET